MSPMDRHRRDRHTKGILFLTLSTVITSNQTTKRTEKDAKSLHRSAGPCSCPSPTHDRGSSGATTARGTFPDCETLRGRVGG